MNEGFSSGSRQTGPSCSEEVLMVGAEGSDSASPCEDADAFFVRGDSFVTTCMEKRRGVFRGVEWVKNRDAMERNEK